ncbi:MAG: glycosyltransferase family 2 protein [Anaerolineaceae bacterium]|nr:glycosyltransferase family 2 protein [Anaerolineaceae bacterium]
MSISVVIPVYNSEKSLLPLVDQLKIVLPSITSDYEILLVNDGSIDHSWEIICKLTNENSSIIGINLMRNYGQHNALLCGIRSASKELTVTIDDDLQHPPAEIPKLLERLNEGYDVVYGSPQKMPHSFWRNLASRISKRTLAFAMGIKTVREISAFRILRTSLRHAFIDFQSPEVIIDVLLSWGTSRFSSVIVNEKPREIGHSNYTFLMLLSQVLLILTGYSTIPLRVASLLGFGFTIFGLFVLIYVLIVTISLGSIPGWPFLASIISIFSGTQLFTLGIFGEYLGRIFNRSMDRPPYVIGEKVIQKSKEPE